MFLQEPECLDQWHADEQVSWIAVEAGAWVNNEGTGGFQAGTAAAQGGVWETVHFHANSGNDHAVMTHVQTTHDPHFVKTRQQSIDQDGFQVMLEQTGLSAQINADGTIDQDYGYGEGVDANGGVDVREHVHGVETVGWLAVSLGVGTLGNVRYEAGMTDEEVTHMAYTVNFQEQFRDVPRFFGNIASHHGWDSSQLRQNGASPITTTSATFVIEEEQCIDDETGCDGEAVAGNGCHGNAESIAWLAMSPVTGHANGQYQNLAAQVDNVIMAKPYPRWHRNMGEVGTQTVNTNWVMVTLYGEYRNPIVFCGVPSQNGGDAVSCRITGKRHTTNSEVVYMGDDGTQQRAAAAFKCAPPPGQDETWSETAWCFYIALQEPQCLDQWHGDEEVSWMVIEEGSWLSDDGKQIQSGVVRAASGGWTWVPYRGTGFANSPVTITQIQTMKGQHCTNDDGSGTNTIGDGPSCDGAAEGWQNAISENNGECRNPPCYVASLLCHLTQRVIACRHSARPNRLHTHAPDEELDGPC
jgi:hypothetical protein